ncbi:GNAT family N-acetyltransferase [Nonomuraea sp. NPDC050556]|uniref:GNAT family N-acetyltransferase n=1 Tax=Nonomuraea sp. NPDC050556 TaxID=3364369 RepID=UPI0037AA8DD0
MIRALAGLEELRAACGDDELLMWVAQDLRGGARAWAGGDAVVVAAPQVARHDRVAVFGGTASAARLAGHALAELGPSYRIQGEPGLVGEVAGKLSLRVAARFSMMTLTTPVPAASEGVGWLPAQQEAEVGELLAEHAPHSYAVPGMGGVRRWAGLRVRGRLAAVAAEAWSAPSVGVLAGVATSDAFRGQGLAGRVCGWVSEQLLQAYGRVALVVDDDNVAALRVYERLGYRRRPILTAGP